MIFLFAAAVAKQFLRHTNSKSRACHLRPAGVDPLNPPKMHSSDRPRPTPKAMVSDVCCGEKKGGLPVQV